MLKRNILKLVTVIISFILCSLITLKGVSSKPEVYLFFYFAAAVLAVTMFMIYKKSNVKKNKSLFETFLVVFIVASLFIIGIMLYFYVDSSFASMISYNYTSTAIVSVIFHLAFIMLYLLLCIDDFKNGSNLVSDILLLITTGITIVEFIVFSFYGGEDALKIMFENDNSKSVYIVQNYIYFAIMYLFTFIHKNLNRVS